MGKLLPALMPMLCHVKAVDNVDGFFPADWIAEPKFDGWRCIATRDPDDVVRVFNGRNGAEYTGQLTYLEADLKAVMPVDTVIDGELISPVGFSAVQSVMRMNDPHTPTEAKPALQLVMFDVLRLVGKDVRALPWTDRRTLVEKIYERDDRPSVKLSPVLTVNNQALYNLLDIGWEGLVLKHKLGRYVNGRSPKIVKVKPQQTADARIIGFKPGDAGGRFDGMVGAFEIELIDSEQKPTGAKTTIKCGPDAVHEAVTADPDSYLGRIIEFRHHGLGDKGVPRHPVKPRFRDDLAPAKAATPSGPPPQTSGTRVYQRNYALMGDDNLLKAILQLRAQAGSAYDRVIQREGDPVSELYRAQEVAKTRGLEVSA